MPAPVLAFSVAFLPAPGGLSTAEVTQLSPGSKGSTSPRHQAGTQFPADNTRNEVYPDVTDEILHGR